jgi:signal transduction histidine kinase
MGTWFRRHETDSLEASESLWSVLGVESGRESTCSWERFLDLFGPADRERLEKLCRGENPREEAEAVFRIASGDGEPRSVRIRTHAFRDADGHRQGVLGVALEVTDFIGVDRETAHELRNQLMVVLGNLDLVQMSSIGGTKLARQVERALQSVERCAELTERMLRRSRDRQSPS